MSTRVAVLPQVGHGIRITVRGVRLVFAEVGWWLGGGFKLLRRAPRRAMTWLTGVGFAVWAEVWSLLAVLLVLVVLPGLWARCWPVSFRQRVTHPSWRRRIRRGVRRSWPRLMEACGLSRRVLDPTGATQTRVPVLHRVRWEEPDVLVTAPQLMVGQTVDDVVTRRNGCGSRSGPGRSGSSRTTRTPAARSGSCSPTRSPRSSTPRSRRWMRRRTSMWPMMGVTEDGDPWRPRSGSTP